MVSLTLTIPQYMSVYFDCLWWWRTEFGGTWNPYIEPETNSTSNNPSTNTAGLSTSAMDHQNVNTGPDLTSINLASFPDLLADASEVPDWNFGIDLDWNFACETPRRSGT